MILAKALTNVKARYYDLGSVNRFFMKLAFGTLWMCLLNQVHFALPFSPVPISLGPSVAAFLGALIGPAAALASVASFIALGVSGAPVFAGAVFGPTWGYLVGYMGAAFMMGKLVQRMEKKTFARFYLALLSSNLSLYISGCVWLALFVGWQKVLTLGFIPFMPGMLFKDAALTLLFMKGKKLSSLDAG
jgi:biotin transport system substrate-specific component